MISGLKDILDPMVSEAKKKGRVQERLEEIADLLKFPQ